MLCIVRNLQADTFWNTQISQVVMDTAGTFELVPVLGNQKIVFGDTSRMRDKFDNLFAFYKTVLNRIGWDKYETLDLRFKGQVIASPSLPYKGPADKVVDKMNWINTIVAQEAQNEAVDTASNDDDDDTVVKAKVVPKEDKIKDAPKKDIDKKTTKKEEQTKDKRERDKKHIKAPPDKKHLTKAKEKNSEKDKKR